MSSLEFHIAITKNLQYKTHPEIWPPHRRIFKTSLYYKTRLILETRRYALFCNKCNKKYIGETKRQFITRWKEHAADTRHNRDTPVAKHMTHCGQNHNIIDTCIVSKIHGHPDRTTQQRKTKEKWWIHTLNPHIPNGLNLMEWEQTPHYTMKVPL